LIATNTTVSRPDCLESDLKSEQGGLSGAPLKSLSTDIIAKFYKVLNGDVPIIGVGGIADSDDAWEKMLAGADFLQVYSQLIYQGPAMISDIVCGISSKLNEAGFDNLASAMKVLRSSKLG
jgi:dihydroorotate dehydrogenase